IERFHPTDYVAEVKAAKALIGERKELARVIEQGGRTEYTSEGRRFYARGLRQAQQGDFRSAQQTWKAVVKLYDRLPGEAKWVRLAKMGLSMLERKELPGPGATSAVVAEALWQNTQEQIGKLRADGHEADANGMLQAWEELYRDDPATRDRLRTNRPK
ncbi:MAG: hypothetical protein ACRCZF_27435, partial [Gemmataceae bacterium]